MAKAKNTNAPEGTTDSVNLSDPPKEPTDSVDSSQTNTPPLDTPPSDPTDSDEVKEGAAFMVNWRLEGFRGQAFEQGEVVEADPQEVASLVECGVLSPLSAEVEG